MNTPDRTYAINDGLETFVHIKDFANDDLVDFWRLQQSGFFYQSTALRPPSMPSSDLSLQTMAGGENDNVECVVDFRTVAIYFAEAIHCLTRLYEGLLGDEAEVTLISGLVGTNGRILVSLGPFSLPLLVRYVCRIPEIIIERRHPLAEWRAGLIDHAVEAAHEVYQRFNWPNPNLDSARTAIEKMLARRW